MHPTVAFMQRTVICLTVLALGYVVSTVANPQDYPQFAQQQEDPSIPITFIGVELVKRTTRRSEPTEAGRVFYERIKPAVAAIIEARAEAANLRGEVSGPLKVGAPILFASSYVAPIVSRFLKLYPNVDVELRQLVTLVHNPAVSILATTWSATGIIGTVGSQKVGSVRDNVRDLTDEFINAYLAANPKR